MKRPATAAAALILLTTLLPAQTTVGTSVRTLTLSPEEIFVDLVISTPNDTLLEEAVSHLAALKVAASDLRGVGTLREDTGRLGWQFSYIRPYAELAVTVKQLEALRRQLRERAVPLQYQFFLRPSPRTLDAAKRKLLAEMVQEARAKAGGSGKLRSVTLEPQPEHIDSTRAPLLFGQSSGSFQYNFALVAVFDQE